MTNFELIKELMKCPAGKEVEAYVEAAYNGVMVTGMVGIVDSGCDDDDDDSNITLYLETKTEKQMPNYPAARHTCRKDKDIRGTYIVVNGYPGSYGFWLREAAMITTNEARTKIFQAYLYMNGNPDLPHEIEDYIVELVTENNWNHEWHIGS